MPLQIETFVSRMFDQNALLLYTEPGSAAVVVDPGFVTTGLLRRLREQRLTLQYILNTHGHVDHIAGNLAVKDAFPDAPLLIGAGDAPMLLDATLNLSEPFGMPITSPPADRTLTEGEVLTFAGRDWTVREIPGHSPGHVVFVSSDPVPVVIGGDVLFAGSIGRTDFPGGSMNQLLRGIRDKLLILPDDTVVYTGHGPSTTIGAERRDNPFLTGLIAVPDA